MSAARQRRATRAIFAGLAIEDGHQGVVGAPMRAYRKLGIRSRRELAGSLGLLVAIDALLDAAPEQPVR